MGHFARADTMFAGVSYRIKTTEQVRDAMSRKVKELKVRIADRETRTMRIRDEYSIDAERLAVLVMRYRESTRNQTVSYDRQGGDRDEVLVPAGVIANLVRERDMIDSEREQIRKLELILRNLADEELYHVPETGEVRTRRAIHELEDDELEYLGF